MEKCGSIRISISKSVTPKHDQHTFTSSPWFSCVVDTRSGAWSNLGCWSNVRTLGKKWVKILSAPQEPASDLVSSKNDRPIRESEFQVTWSFKPTQNQIIFALDILPASQFFGMVTFTKTFQVTQFIAILKKIGNLEMMVETLGSWIILGIVFFRFGFFGGDLLFYPFSLRFAASWS